jgi:hypothetical protein
MNGSKLIDAAAAAKLPAVSAAGVPDQKQATDVATHLAANWAKAVG